MSWSSSGFVAVEITTPMTSNHLFTCPHLRRSLAATLQEPDGVNASFFWRRCDAVMSLRERSPSSISGDLHIAILGSRTSSPRTRAIIFSNILTSRAIVACSSQSCEETNELLICGFIFVTVKEWHLFAVHAQKNTEE